MLGIICAMHDEIAALLSVLKESTTQNIGNRTYYKGKINQTEVVIVFSKWGKVAASITTTQLINSYQPSQIIFTGVAGGLAPHLNIGDVIYGTSLIQHDMDASPLFKTFEIPLIGVSDIKTSDNAKLLAATKKFMDDYNKYINPAEKSAFSIKQPQLEQGLICSGDTFVNGITKINQLKQNIPNALAVEMEGAAVAQVCLEYAIPLNVIRIISDKADESAAIDFPEFTKKIASKYAKAILETYCD